MGKRDSIIDYDSLEKAIVDIEKYLKKFDMVEADLILKQIIERRSKTKQQQRINDNMQNVKLGNLVKKFMKGDREEEGD